MTHKLWRPYNKKKKKKIDTETPQRPSATYPPAFPEIISRCSDEPLRRYRRSNNNRSRHHNQSHHHYHQQYVAGNEKTIRRANTPARIVNPGDNPLIKCPCNGENKGAKIRPNTILI